MKLASTLVLSLLAAAGSVAGRSLPELSPGRYWQNDTYPTTDNLAVFNSTNKPTQSPGHPDGEPAKVDNATEVLWCETTVGAKSTLEPSGPSYACLSMPFGKAPLKGRRVHFHTYMPVLDGSSNTARSLSNDTGHQDHPASQSNHTGHQDHPTSQHGQPMVIAWPDNDNDADAVDDGQGDDGQDGVVRRSVNHGKHHPKEGVEDVDAGNVDANIDGDDETLPSKGGFSQESDAADDTSSSGTDGDESSGANIDGESSGESGSSSTRDEKAKRKAIAKRSTVSTSVPISLDCDAASQYMAHACPRLADSSPNNKINIFMNVDQGGASGPKPA